MTWRSPWFHCLLLTQQHNEQHHGCNGRKHGSRCVYMRRHMYLRYAAIALFWVDGATICVKPCDENALFVADCYIHTGDIPKAKVKFVMTTQVARGQS